MALSDSMFLFELAVKGIKYCKVENETRITAEFGDVFNVTLKSPKSVAPTNKTKVDVKPRCKVRNINITKKKYPCLDTRMSQSIIIVSKPNLLLSNMKKNPLKVSLCESYDLNCKLGFAVIPWRKTYINYLNNVQKKLELSPPYLEGSYSLYDELNSKRIASVEMCLKLIHLGSIMTCQFRSISDDMPTFMNTKNNFTPNEDLNAISKTRFDYIDENQMNISRGCIKGNPDLTENIRTALKYKCYENVSQTSFQSISNPVGVIRSYSEIVKEKEMNISRSLSCSSFYSKRKTLKYIFADPKGTFGNQVYCVGYFSVKNDNSNRNSAKDNDENLQKPSQLIKKFKFKKCDSECRVKQRQGSNTNSSFSLNLSEDAAKINIAKCKEIDCNERDHRKLPPPPDDRILLNLSNLKNDCCNANTIEEKIEEVIGGLTAKMKIGEDPCYCTCECTFGFTKKTTYCNVCGGYEVAGDELGKIPVRDMPMPCPLFHKIIDKNKLKTYSTSGSESRKKVEDQKVLKVSSSQKAVSSDKRQAVSEKKSVESEKDSKKGKKKKRDDRFKFNYGYKAPQIGHSKCGLPCAGTLDNVPKHMGWLWTAENVPGIKFRPMWKPGATNKHVVRLLKIARNPGEMLSKKKRKDNNKRKRPLKRPLLIVQKKDGEFTVTMETMKNYSKPRALNQQPYEDKPVVTYTIGRTDEENRIRQKKKERARRRLERAQRQFIQSAFRNMCEEICLKTYQQALGILPTTEDPKCTCYPAIPTAKTTNMDISCSCSEESLISSDTDSDEWIVEFTPPNAAFDPTYKGKKVVKVDNGSQYTYLDYRVKLVDRFGNPVPRFFKGLDGKQQCSDLGGFWSPDHKWLEINIDGYIAPDGRWAPNTFTGPNGEQVDAETGKFQATNGKWLVVGVDGYIDCNGRWKYYPVPAGSSRKKRPGTQGRKLVKAGEQKYEKSETSWSCFGDVSPKQLSKLGIVGHGGDRKLLVSTLQDMLAHGEDVYIPQPKTVFRLPITKKRKMGAKEVEKRKVVSLREVKCHHPIPSDKGIVAVDAYGNKTYFRLKSRKNLRPKERLSALADQGISLSSFHVPCFNSFINSEILKRQQRLAHTTKNIATQAS